VPRGRPRQFDIDKALKAALQLFWRRGYEGTSLAALTAAMRINTPSLYAAFGNKEALFKKALDLYLQRPASYLPDALEQPTARAAAEQLFRGAIDMVMNGRHADGCLLVHGALVSGPEARKVQKILAQHRAGAESLIRERFERARVEGDLAASADPEKLARFIATVLWGLSVQAATGVSREELEQVAATAMQSWPG
jgi:AcrR family transcriptional regulator